jgi:hypothetical protein
MIPLLSLCQIEISIIRHFLRYYHRHYDFYQTYDHHHPVSDAILRKSTNENGQTLHLIIENTHGASRNDRAVCVFTKSFIQRSESIKPKPLPLPLQKHQQALPFPFRQPPIAVNELLLRRV